MDDNVGKLSLADFGLSERDEDFRKREVQFRRGFTHGIVAAMEAIERGATAAEVMNWMGEEAMEWRYNASKLPLNEIHTHQSPGYPMKLADMRESQKADPPGGEDADVQV